MKNNLFSDVRLQSAVELPIHISPNSPESFVTKLTLTAEHNKEIRTYKLSVTKSITV